jgi:hypothetical protein
VDEFQETLKSLPQFRTLAELLTQLFFRRAEVLTACTFLFHPDVNAASGDICTLCSPEIASSLTRF